MSVIIVGGTGLIGRALAATLASAGYDTVILSRHPEGVRGLPTTVRLQGWDGRTSQGWAHLAHGAEAIINLAGESIGAGRWTAARKERIRQSRLAAGRAVVQAVQGASPMPRVVIQASAVGYYGPHGDEEVHEDTPPGSDFLAQVAVDWESSTAPVEEWGVRRVIIRTGVVLSRDGGALPRLLLPFRFFVGGPLGSGRQWLPWIHIADEVAAIRFLLENQDARGPFNLSAPTPMTNAQFSRLVGRILGRPSVFPTPAFALRLLLGEMATVLLDGQRAIPGRLQECGFVFAFPHAEAALHDLLGPMRKEGR